jgi:hypothetical protein
MAPCTAPTVRADARFLPWTLFGNLGSIVRFALLHNQCPDSCASPKLCASRPVLLWHPSSVRIHTSASQPAFPLRVSLFPTRRLSTWLPCIRDGTSATLSIILGRIRTPPPRFLTPRVRRQTVRAQLATCGPFPRRSAAPELINLCTLYRSFCTLRAGLRLPAEPQRQARVDSSPFISYSSVCLHQAGSLSETSPVALPKTFSIFASTRSSCTDSLRIDQACDVLLKVPTRPKKT